MTNKKENKTPTPCCDESTEEILEIFPDGGGMYIKYCPACGREWKKKTIPWKGTTYSHGFPRNTENSI